MHNASASDDQDQPIAAINIIPLVDVVLVLLIIFMVTAVFTKETTMKVELPKEASQHAAEPPVELTVNVDKDANIMVNGRATTIKDLQTTLRAFQNADPAHKTLVVLRGDKRVPYGTMVPVLDNISQTGMAVTIAMQPGGG